MKLLYFIVINFLSTVGMAAELRAFEAKYNISRDGKKTGEQITRLTQLDENLWQIEDHVKGTNGLASFIGFNRTERTEFTESNGRLQATKHNMLQKAALSKKQYQFNWNDPDKSYEIFHKDEKVSFVPENQHIISAQLMPLALSLAACQNLQNMELVVLKNKHPKSYFFSFNHQTPKSAQRVYDEDANKSTQTWFDETKQCLPVKQTHKDHNDPVIETQLTKFTWL